MANALVVQKPQLPSSQQSSRAAQYVRMSTDRQRYSIQNQATVIAAYAHAHNLTIVRTYSDEGESGLRIKNRIGLTKLIHDVGTGNASFDWILVYDISRWGRFQDVDESAHYEFLCKHAGIKVVYCAEQFDNDGSMLSSIVKNLKSVMAAEYSRELSVKVRAGHRHLASLGFKQGGPAGYALHRELFDENMKSKGLLKNGERKYLTGDRVRLRKGSDDEAASVNWIFNQYVVERKSATEIARQLNLQGVPGGLARPWNCSMVCRLLRNENYIGTFVYNRTSRYLGQNAIVNPVHTWIRSVGAIEPIIEQRLFSSAQKITQERRVDLTEEEMLDRLRDTLKKRGRLSSSIINETAGLPSTATYMAHFGTIRSAYRRIGYTTKRDCDWLDSIPYWTDAIAKISALVITDIEKAGGHVQGNETGDCLSINGKVSISFRVARRWSGKEAWHSPRWAIQRRRHLADGWIVAIRLGESNKEILDYLLLPTSSLPKPMIKFTEKGRRRHNARRFGKIKTLVRSIIVGLGESTVSTKSDPRNRRPITKRK
jgi:DNA invertase Pin-like site-specific DNA recombinase